MIRANHYGHAVGLIDERRLSTTGFDRALRSLARELNPGLDDDELDNTVITWFGSPNPDAYRIRRKHKIVRALRIYGVTIEAYEFGPISGLTNRKLTQYGWAAQGDGPEIELHICASGEPEIIVSCDDLCGTLEHEPHMGDRITPAVVELREMIGQLWAERQPRVRPGKSFVKQNAPSVPGHAPALLVQSGCADCGSLQVLSFPLRVDGAVVLLCRKCCALRRQGAAIPLQHVARPRGRPRKTEDKLTRDVERLRKRLAYVEEKSADWKVAYDALSELGIKI